MMQPNLKLQKLTSCYFETVIYLAFLYYLKHGKYANWSYFYLFRLIEMVFLRILKVHLDFLYLFAGIGELILRYRS